MQRFTHAITANKTAITKLTVHILPATCVHSWLPSPSNQTDSWLPSPSNQTALDS